MKARMIRTEREYRDALARIDVLIDAEPGTPEGDELDLLATLVTVYEEKHFPVDQPDPV